jgi:hypothetical protein
MAPSPPRYQFGHIKIDQSKYLFRKIDGFLDRCLADPDPDPTFPFDADPEQDPDSISNFYTQVGNQKFVFDFNSQQCQFILFYLSHQCHSCLNFYYFGQHIEIFLQTSLVYLYLYTWLKWVSRI